MLCKTCKKNIAVVFIKDGNKKEGYCISCAKKEGIDTTKIMLEQANSEKFNLSNITAQLEQFMSELSPEEIENLASTPLASFSINSDDGSFNMNDGLNEKITQKNINNKNKKETKKTKALDTFGENLTLKASEGKLDDVLGRERELERIIQILNRRNKNNPTLLGEPGVGKTALVNALAIKIANGNVPAKLQNKQIYLLDMTSLIAGSQFRGQFEGRVKSIIEECKENKNIILAIDEVHTIVGGREQDNSMNAANMLKPALANGDVQIIGATTLKEYRMHIEKDTALERRFQPVIIEEPTEENCFKMLKGIKKYSENFHKVTIPDTTLYDAIELSVKYIHDRFLPDKAIDLLDEASSYVNLEDTILNESTVLSFKISAFEKILQDYESELEDLHEDDVETREVFYEKIANAKGEIAKYTDELESLTDKLKPNKVTKEHLARAVELWTKIPVSRITTSTKTKLLNLENNLKKKIIGQDKAVSALSHAILRKRAGIVTTMKPPSFIFVGPTGVGKTALVKALAYEMFDNENSVIKLDMSEYSESHSSSKLIGSPPGYVGYDEAGQLTEKIRRNPYSIILFDEIEKAHPSIYNVLLQILDEGKLTDSQGKTVSFKHTIIVMTSNLGTNFKSDSYGFGTIKDNKDILSSKVNDSVKEFFSPEFLNRIDDIITFNKLGKTELNEITKLMIKEFIAETSKKGYTFNFTDNVTNYISSIGYDPKFGARPLKRSIEKYIEDFIAIKSIKDEIKQKKEYTIDAIDNEIVLV